MSEVLCDIILDDNQFVELKSYQRRSPSNRKRFFKTWNFNKSVCGDGVHREFFVDRVNLENLISRGFEGESLWRFHDFKVTTKTNKGGNRTIRSYDDLDLYSARSNVAELLVELPKGNKKQIAAALLVEESELKTEQAELKSEIKNIIRLQNVETWMVEKGKDLLPEAL